MVAERPFVAASLSMFNPLDATHATIASIGYPDHVLSHLDGWFVGNDISYRHYRTQGRRQKALKWCEMPFDYQNTFSVREVFRPAGYREGVTLCLHSRDGRYTGNLHVSTEDSRYPTKYMLGEEIQSLQTVLGNFSDRLRHIAARLPCLSSSNGCLTTSQGGIFDVPGIDPIDPDLRNELVASVQRLGEVDVPDVFMFKHLSTWFCVHTGVVDGARSFIAKRCTVPFALTDRELQIIELLISGDTNYEIAAKIFLARATVSKHLENIFQKLGCNSRTSVVGIALANNLRLPFRERPASMNLS